MIDSDMLDATDALRRRELAAFLRARRLALAPATLDLATGPRRRVHGLRREEVAQMLGVSVSWYTKLEQGIAPAISPRLVSRLAEALHLNASDRAHLSSLALAGPPNSVQTPPEAVRQMAQRMIDSMEHSAAFLLTGWGDFLAVNRAARALFRPLPVRDGQPVNQLIDLFLSDETRPKLPDWEESARRQVAMFRAAFAKEPENPRFLDIINHLYERSAEFAAIWSRYDLPETPFRSVGYLHRGNRLSFEHFDLFLSFERLYRIEMFSPSDTATHAYIAALLARGPEKDDSAHM